MDKLVNSFDKKELWSILTELRGKKSGAPISMNDLETHFSTLLNNSPKNIPDRKIELLKAKLLEFLNQPEDNLKSGGYTRDFLIKMSKSLKNGKSAFLDGAINEVLKHSMSGLGDIFVKFFNHIEFSATFPNQWKSSFLVPLHKKGSRGDPDNYRGLACGSNIGKFYTKCLNQKLKNYMEENELLSPHQFGFRDDYRTSDAIFSLRSIISHYKNSPTFKNKPIYACFVDFSKAFDSVNRTAMAYKLGTVGIKGNLLKLFINMYDHADYIIKSNSEFSHPVHSTLGVKQGCNLSPLLFNIFINDIHQIFNKNCDPINVNNWHINSLSFADDLVILSESPTGLSNSLKNLETYCNQWGLKVNAKKTKVMVFNKPYTQKVKNLFYSLDGDRIETTKSYCYLGVEVTNTGSFHLASNALYNKALRALFSLYSAIDVRSDKPNIKLYLKLFDSLIKPILIYGCEIWGPIISQKNNVISKFVNRFYRTLLGVPGHTSTVGIHVELGRFPIDINIYSAMIKYWTRLVALPKNRLVSHCYWSLQTSISTVDPWLNTMRNIIFATGQCHMWYNQTAIDVLDFKSLARCQNYMCQNLKDQFLQQSTEKMESETKLSLFKNSKNTFSASSYLSAISNRKSRSLLSKLRLGVLPLEIEKGRRKNIVRENRFCKICNLNVLENEVHFLFECPTLEKDRSKHINSIAKISPRFRTMSNTEKLTFLYFNEKTPNSLLDIASTFLSELWNARVPLRLNIALNS